MPSKNVPGIVIASLVIVLAVSVASDIYLRVTYDKKITSLGEEYQGKLDELQVEYESKIDNLMEVIQSSGKKIESLSSEVEKTQEQTDSKFSMLEDELKGISVEAGDFSAVVEDAIKGVVSILTDKGQGSGTIITSDGYIVTNYHVINDISQLSIVTYDGKVYPGSLVGQEKLNDIAVLKVMTNDTFDELNFADSDNVKVGEKVVALGNPVGLGFSVTQGIISQTDRRISGSVGLLQTDVPINPGNSGGPLINSAGKVVGILRSKIAGYESLGFAIPSNYIVQVAKEIIGKDI